VNDYLVIPKKAALATKVAASERKIIGIPDQRDCSVYISIPFCPSRCSYCSFVSYSSKKLLALIPEYLESLKKDICANFDLIKKLGLKVKTVYIGGGTPTILDEGQLCDLLGTVSNNIDTDTLEEYTLEAGRPDTITEEKLAVAAAHGVTRISVNPQSLCPEVLDRVGRHHTVDEFYKAYNIAAKSGIKYINTDLIVGLPGDSFKTFSTTFDEILALRPANITVHTFCVKKSADIVKSSADIFSMRGGDATKCVDYTQVKSLQAGYSPYYMYRQKKTVGNLENVGFALEGAEGLYNVHMMEETHSIFAVGAGAVTKIVKNYSSSDEAKKGKIVRLFNPKYPYEYLSDNKCPEMLREIERYYTEEIFANE
jgi:oxygen-independent coproporphyrinogen-3 oxidase